jgi:hypothetical protein
MRIDKIVLRAAISSFSAIVCLLGILIFVLAYLFPATMMNITYDLGMDGASITCAKRSYDRTEQVYYIAFATEVAIVSEDCKQITECGKRFIEDDAQAFASYCETKNQTLSQEIAGTYEQYVFGQICVAEYRLGEKTQAINDSFAYLHGGFPVNNSVVTLLFTAMQAGDMETAQTVKQKLSEIQTGALADADRAYFNEILVALGA